MLSWFEHEKFFMTSRQGPLPVMAISISPHVQTTETKLSLFFLTTFCREFLFHFLTFKALQMKFVDFANRKEPDEQPNINLQSLPVAFDYAI